MLPANSHPNSRPSAEPAPRADALPVAVLRSVAHLRPGARVVVAMSGGVDSSVVAAVLKSAGFDVIGLTMQLYDHGKATGKSGSCCAGQDIHDARMVADRLDFPHYVLDYESRFKERVIAPFIDSYVQGETPIPCVSCNSDLKFGELLSTAQTLGADALATGHYVQRQQGPDGAELRRAVDGDRDQSYFLFSTTRAQLANLVFPLGGINKPEVRALARALGVPLADKADSQDICFVPQGRYTDVIAKLRPEAAEPGEIVHTDGRVLGGHPGIVHFTVGQRKGLGIATGEPLFVVRIDADNRRVIVGPRSQLGVDRIELRGVNWLGADCALTSDGVPIFVRTRSSQPLRAGRFYPDRSGSGDAHGSINPGTGIVRLETPELGIAPGQACVFYDGDGPEARVLGGGFISRTALEAAQTDAADCDNQSLRRADERRKSAATELSGSGMKPEQATTAHGPDRYIRS